MAALSFTESIVINTYFKVMVVTAGFALVAARDMLINGQRAYQKLCLKFLIDPVSPAFLQNFGIFLRTNHIGKITWIAL